MVGRDTVTFRFRLDAKEMQRLIKALEADARRFGGTMERVSGQSDKLGTGLKNSGNNAAAAAVNFQTATQGMLNLSTAAVQTFTSISNLDRAANRLAQSKIAVARAEDLLANKQLRLNELQERGLGHTSKAVNLTNELATARADLAVKNDKARIEEGALLDIQLLFVTNVANVMISSIQTIKTLRDMQALSTIRATIAESGLIVKTKALVLAQTSQIMTAKGVITVTKGMSFSIKGLTFSVRGLMLALGPIAIAITAVTIAMQAYEENWGGFKDAVQTALPFLKESNDDLDESQRILDEDRKAMEGYVSAIDSMGNSMKKLSSPHKQYLEMMRDAHLQMDANSKLAAFYSSQLAGIRTSSQGFSTPSVGGGLPSSGGGGTGTSTTSTVSSGGGGTPSTRTAPAVAGASGDLADPFGSGEQRFVFAQLPKEDKMNMLLNKAQSFMSQGNFQAANLYFAEHEKAKTRPQIETDPVKAFKNIMVKGTGFFGGAPTSTPSRIVDAKMQQNRFGTDLFDIERFDQTHEGTKRGEIMNLTGVDIGNIANVIDKNDAIRIANLQRTLGQFNQPTPGMTGGRSGGRANLAIAAVGGNATQAFQVSSVNWKGKSAWKAGLARGDSFANGAGAIVANVPGLLTGRTFRGYRQRRGSGGWNALQQTKGSRSIVAKAVEMGIKSNPDYIERIAEIPEIDTRDPNNIRQAWAALRVAESIASEYVGMVTGFMGDVGFTNSFTTQAAIAGYSGVGMYENIALMAATKRTNFNNTELIETSRNKLNLTNSQIFAIRFDSTRGDRELQDRLRYVDQLEAMSSGTSPL